MLHKIALLLHILSVLVLFAGIGGIVVGTYGMRRSATMKQFAEWTWLATTTDKIMPFASAGVVLSGIYMVMTAWGWQTMWAVVALVTFVLMVALGPFLIGPRLLHIKKDIKKLPDTVEGVPDHLHAQASDPLLWMVLIVFTVMAFSIVVLMTLKPGLSGSLITVGGAFILALLCNLPLLRVRQAPDALTSTLVEQ